MPYLDVAVLTILGFVAASYFKSEGVAPVLAALLGLAVALVVYFVSPHIN